MKESNNSIDTKFFMTINLVRYDWSIIKIMWVVNQCKTNVIPIIATYLDKFWKMLNGCVFSITQNKYHTYKTNGYSNISQIFQIIYYEENYIPRDPLSLCLSTCWIYFTIFFKNEVKQYFWATNLVLSILRNFNQSQTKLL